jgi:hypothetical protein
MAFEKKKIFSAFTTDVFIRFLKELDFLKLDKEDFKILKNFKITGYNFLCFKKDDFISSGLAVGPSITLMQLISVLKKVYLDFYFHCLFLLFFRLIFSIV